MAEAFLSELLVPLHVSTRLFYPRTQIFLRCPVPCQAILEEIFTSSSERVERRSPHDQDNKQDCIEQQ